MLVFTWSDLVLFLKRLNSSPPNEPHYVIEIVDMRSVPSIKIGFSASGIFLELNELEELKQLLTKACQRIDLESIFRNTITNN